MISVPLCELLLEISMNKKKSIFKVLMTYAGSYRYYTYVGMLFSALSAILSIAPFVLIWLCICEVIRMYPNISFGGNALYYAIGAVGAALLSMFIYVTALMCTHKSAFRVARNIKTTTMEHLAHLPLGYFGTTTSGKLRRIVNDSAAQTESYLAHHLPDIVGAYLTPILVLCLIFIVDWKLGLACFLALFLSLMCQVAMMGGSDFMEKMRRYQDSLATMNSEAVEYVRGIPVVKTFGQSIFSFKKFHKIIHDYSVFIVDYTKFFRIPMVLYTLFIGGGISIFLVTCGIWLYTSEASSTEFLLNFIFYVLISPLFSLMMMRIMWATQNSMLAKNAVNNIDTILAVKPLKEGSEPFPAGFNITLDNVSFRYDDTDNDTLHSINMQVSQGETVALVGSSGGGKSTLAALIARFWDVTQGSIKIGGVDVRDIKQDELMKNISFVFQNTNLYKMSLLDNVREGKPDATEQEVLTAMRAARCEEILKRLPDGIHTIVGRDGIHFSGGEAQRISIARAILKDAPIVLLDEATAFTDPENEYLIQQALNELSKGKTVIIVAHRLSTVKDVNRIYVVDRGAIIEQGTHSELINANGTFASLWNEYQSVFAWN